MPSTKLGQIERLEAVKEAYEKAKAHAESLGDTHWTEVYDDPIQDTERKIKDLVEKP